MFVPGCLLFSSRAKAMAASGQFERECECWKYDVVFPFAFCSLLVCVVACPPVTLMFINTQLGKDGSV